MIAFLDRWDGRLGFVGKKRGNCSIIWSRLKRNGISPLFWSLLDFIHLAGIESNVGNEAEANCLHQSAGRAQLHMEEPEKKNHLRDGGKTGGEAL